MTDTTLPGCTATYPDGGCPPAITTQAAQPAAPPPNDLAYTGVGWVSAAIILAAICLFVGAMFIAGQRLAEKWADRFWGEAP